MKTNLIIIISWIISAILLFPCLFLSMLSMFTIDYHYMFHIWWANNVLNKKYSKEGEKSICICSNGTITCPGCEGEKESQFGKCAGCKGSGVRTCGKCGG